MHGWEIAVILRNFHRTKLSKSKNFFFFFFSFFFSISTYIQCATRRLSLCDIRKYRFPTFYGTSDRQAAIFFWTCMIQTWSSFSLMDPCSIFFCSSVKPKFFTPTHARGRCWARCSDDVCVLCPSWEQWAATQQLWRWRWSSFRPLSLSCRKRRRSFSDSWLCWRMPATAELLAPRAPPTLSTSTTTPTSRSVGSGCVVQLMDLWITWSVCLSSLVCVVGLFLCMLMQCIGFVGVLFFYA